MTVPFNELSRRTKQRHGSRNLTFKTRQNRITHASWRSHVVDTAHASFETKENAGKKKEPTPQSSWCLFIPDETKISEQIKDDDDYYILSNRRWQSVRFVENILFFYVKSCGIRWWSELLPPGDSVSVGSGVGWMTHCGVAIWTWSDICMTCLTWDRGGMLTVQSAVCNILQYISVL